MRRSIVEQVGRFDSEMDGAQDWDLALRVSSCSSNIIHIPKILYHWRQIQGSVSLDPNAKPWAYPAQKRCITAHLKRIGYPDAEFSIQAFSAPRILFPTKGVTVTILIPTKDKLDLLRPCIASILKDTKYPNYEIIIIDTGSIETETFEYYETLKSYPNIRQLTLKGRFNWSKVNNWGAKQANGTVLLCLNNDIEIIDPLWLNELVGWAMRPEIGVVGTRLLYPNGKIQHNGIILGLDGHGSHLFEGEQENRYGIFGSTDWVRNCSAVTGACLMVRKNLFDRLSGFDELYDVSYSDIEFCLRVNDLGYRNICTPFARLTHYHGATRGGYQPLSDVLRFTFQIMKRVQQGDPFLIKIFPIKAAYLPFIDLLKLHRDNI